LTQMFPSTTSPHEAIPPQSPVSLSSDGLPQAAITSQSPATLLPPPTPGQTKRRRSPAIVVVLILLTLLLLGGSFGIYGAVTGDWPWLSHSCTCNLTGVAWSGSQFVVVADNGTILTSSDGRTWTAQHAQEWLSHGQSPDLQSVAWSGSQFVAVGDSGTILTSPDGRTWTTW
jgi:hypothetical protein